MKQRKQTLCIMLCVLLAVLFVPMPAYAAERSGLKKIRVGCSLSTGYHQKDASGEISGYGYTYEQLLAQYAGWEIEYVEGSWYELQTMLADGDIDLLGFLVKTEQREKIYDFSDTAAGESMSCLISRTDDTRFTYQEYQAFDGMTVAYQNSNANLSGFLQYAKENGFAVKLREYGTYEEVYDALNSKAVDAALMTNFQDLSAYNVIDQLLNVNFYYAVTKGNQTMLDELNAALTDANAFYSDIPDYLYEKYYDIQNGRDGIFTKEELTYLAQKPIVTVVKGGREKPYESYNSDTGEYEGIVPDILTEISKNTGIQFVYYPSEDRWDFPTDTSEKNVITSLTSDIDWAKHNGLYITQPFMEGSISIVTKEKETKISSVAMIEDRYLNKLVHQKEADWTISYFNNIEACLDAVRSEQCDATVMNGYEADYYLSLGRYAMMKETIFPGVQQNICLAVTDTSDPLLPQILAKSLLMISTETYDGIIRQHVSFQNSTTIEDFIYSNPLQAIMISVTTALLLLFSICMVIYAISMRKKNQEVIAANRAKTEFLSRMSHDIRTPMNTIVNLTRIVQDEIDDKAAALDDLKKMETSNQFLLALVNDVLDMSKIEEGEMQLYAEPYTCAEFFNYIHSTFDPLSQEKNVTFVVKCAQQKSDIMIDKVRFNQLCFNLLSNAMKYTPAGGHVEFCMIQGDVSGDSFPCDIYVRDNGIGMSAEFQAKMFEPFSQEGRAYKTVEGTGLGLPIVKQIVELLNGTIEVESELGKGSCFHVHLEMQLAKASAPQKKKILDHSLLKHKQILVVEDHPLNQEIAKKLLEKVQIQVFIVNDGEQAVRAFQQAPERYDAILMDLRMPNMDGYTAAKTIRAMSCERAQSIPIIAMTANAYAEDVQKCKEVGMNAHLAKPIDPSLLYDTLAEFIGS